MTLGLKKEIMPHVRFENRDYGRNEQASLEAGRHVPMNATFIIITSHGSKDEYTALADEWLPHKRMQASNGSYNIDWVEHFEKQYKYWKEGHELPRQGTPVLTWQMLSPEQNARVRACGITVVEDLAAIPDSGLNLLGLDGRVLRDMARAWLAEGQDKGINTRALADANAKIATQQGIIERQEDRLKVLEARLEEMDPPKRRKTG
jgi:hypothetical protein